MTDSAEGIEERNPFAPPAANLGAVAEDLNVLALPRPTPLQRLVLVALGFLLPVGAYAAVAMGSTLLGRLWSGGPGGLFFSLLPALALALHIAYLPMALFRIRASAATLPMRFLGYRFIRADGATAGFARIWFLWWLPGSGLLVGSCVLGITAADELSMALLLMSAGPLLLVADLMVARRASRRTLRDQFAGLIMVKP